jgi:hypothetical protein
LRIKLRARSARFSYGRQYQFRWSHANVSNPENVAL